MYLYTGEREINDLKVKCAHSKDGCEWNGALAGLKKHRSLCNEELVPCPNKCKENSKVTQIHRKNLEVHLKDDCPNRSFKCPHCKQEGKHHDITTSHLKKCLWLTITCPNEGCGEQITRCSLNNHLIVCPFQVVPCKYLRIGCSETRVRNIVKDHEADDQSHLGLAMEKILEQESVLMQYRKTTFKMARFFTYQLFEGTTLVHPQLFSSPPFYSHGGGYKMQVKVYTKGVGDGEGTHIAISPSIMKGEFDDSLTWPFTGSVTVELLNQLEDKNHYKQIYRYRQATKNEVKREFANGEQLLGLEAKFISHKALRYNLDTNCQHLKDDCLYFRVAVTPDSVKPWLTPTV